MQRSPSHSALAALAAVFAVFVSGCTGPNATDQPPVASFDLQRDVVEVDELLVFSGNLSHDAEGPISTYQWNFGDLVQESGPVVSHRYSASGSFTVTLTVADAVGNVNSHAANLTVNAPPTAILDVSPGPYFAKEPISFSAQFSHDPDGRITSYLWTFGDGATASSQDVAHFYTDTGEFTILLDVTDDRGAHARATTSLFADLHTYNVAFEERSNNLPDVNNFTIANMTKTSTVEVFQLNVTLVTMRLDILRVLPEGTDSGDVIRFTVTSPEGASQVIEGSANFTLSFNLNAIPSPVQTRAATPGDVPGILGDAYLGQKGRGVWVVEVTAVQLGTIRDGGFIPELIIGWQLHTTVTTYEATPTQIA